MKNYKSVQAELLMAQTLQNKWLGHHFQVKKHGSTKVLVEGKEKKLWNRKRKLQIAATSM